MEMKLGTKGQTRELRRQLDHGSIGADAPTFASICYLFFSGNQVFVFKLLFALLNKLIVNYQNHIDLIIE
jgi:hypothetical protein